MATKALNKKLIEESKKTIEEALSCLNSYGKVFVCRPTGFGKTYMLIQIATKYRSKFPKKRIAYVYPLNIIPDEIKVKYGKNSPDSKVRDTVNKSIDFISYSELTRKYNDNDEGYWYNQFKDKYSIILLDEVHASGSEGFRNVYDEIKGLIGVEENKIRLVGVTATPNRMDDEEGTSVLESIFDNHQVYKYTLANCIQDGILKRLVIGTYRYDIKDFAETLKLKQKDVCKKKGLFFDDNSFNMELEKITRENGNEGEFIYKYLELAGYDLADSNTKYFKFIVFLRNIQDVADRGSEIEGWFNTAFNEVAKNKLGLKRDFTIRSHYLTSSDTEDNSIKGLVDENDNRFRYTSTQKLTKQDLKDKYIVDVILTVNMTNMGYHDDDITGILMLRGTKSSIIYYQQLGRAISVTSEYPPLIYDFVNNVNTDYSSKKDRRITLARDILGTPNDRGETENEGIDYYNLVARVESDYDACDDFLNRWSDDYYSEKAYMKYWYEDRHCPLIAISADLHKPCLYIAKKLKEFGVELRDEDAMYRFENALIERARKVNDLETENNSLFVMKYLNSSNASSMYIAAKKLSSAKTLYNFIKSLK
jgi:superfamily II DNA or RNA helicase